VQIIRAAGGAYVLPPEVVRDVGHGSLKKGERVLDLFVRKVRGPIYGRAGET
jgi:hypothetical protein